MMVIISLNCDDDGRLGAVMQRRFTQTKWQRCVMCLFRVSIVSLSLSCLYRVSNKVAKVQTPEAKDVKMGSKGVGEAVRGQGGQVPAGGRAAETPDVKKRLRKDASATEVVKKRLFVVKKRLRKEKDASATEVV